MTDLTPRDISANHRPGFLHLDRNQVYISVNHLLGLEPGSITVDSPIATDILVKLAEAFFVAQNEYNLTNTPKIATLSHRILTPRVLDKKINAQLSYEITCYGFLKSNDITVITN